MRPLLFILILFFISTAAVPLLAKEQTDSLPDTVWTFYTNSGGFNYVKFLPDGQHFIAHYLYGTQIRKVKDGEIAKQFNGDSAIIPPIDVAASKKMVAGANGAIPVSDDERAKPRNILVSDYETGKFIQKLNADKYLKRDLRWVNSISFSGDGEHLAAVFYSEDKKMDGSSDTSMLIIWNTSNWVEEKSILLLGTGEFSVTYSPTNDYLMICQSNNYYSDTIKKQFNYVGLINTSTWEGSLVKKPYITFGSSNPGFKFSPDGKMVALRCTYYESNKKFSGVVVWNTPDFNSYKIFKMNGGYPSLTFSKDSKYLAYLVVNPPNKIEVWDIDKMQRVYSYPLQNYFTEYFQFGESSSSMDISLDNNYLLNGGGGLILFNAKWNITDVKTNDLQEEITIYPNPSDGEVKISFSSVQPDYAKITIFNNEGSEISSIYNGIINPGENNFTWDSNTFPSGVYFCKVEGTNIHKTIKIIINK